MTPQARLDVHGFTAAETREKLESFLDSCFMRNLECVLVVHGEKLLGRVVRQVLEESTLVDHFNSDTGSNLGATRVWLQPRS